MAPILKFGYWVTFSTTPHIILKDTLLHIIKNIDNNLQDLIEPILIKTVLLASNSFDTNTNTDVLNLTLNYALSTKKIY